jgi:outer membrane protein
VSTHCTRAAVARACRLACAAGLLGVLLAPAAAQAQQQIGHIDSEYILNQMPEYATVQQKLDQLEQQWRSEIQAKKERVEELRQEFQARELLYTDEERARKQEAIAQAQQEVEQLRERYFGPDGELYSRQKQLMRPIQERVLAAVDEVSTTRGFDYVFDKSGDFVFMFARDEYDLSDPVLRELGINVEREGNDASGEQP